MLNKDVLILENRMKEFKDIADQLRDKANRFRASSDHAIVAHSQEVFDLQRKVKNNNFEGKRLELDDDELLGDSSKFEESPDTYNYQPKHMPGTKPPKMKENNLNIEPNDNNDGEHVFFVQLDSELPMPQFLINISKEKKKIEEIGYIKNSFFPSQRVGEEVQESERSRGMSDADLHLSSFNRPPIPKLPFKSKQDEVKEFMANYQSTSNLFSSHHSPMMRKGMKKGGLSYNDKVGTHENELSAAISQRIIETEKTVIQSDMSRGRDMYWFKWDSQD